MKKNRLQRLQEDMNEDLQKYLDEDLLDTTLKEGIYFLDEVCSFMFIM